jgi:outer membrane protein insertion porin family
VQNVFAVTIDKVDVKGNRRVPLSRISDFLVKPGDNFDLAKIDESIKLIYQTGLFLDVSVDMNLDDKLELIYYLKEKPIVNKIYFEGNKEFKQKDLRDKIPLKENSQFDKKLIEKSLIEIRNAYEKENFYNVKVDVELEDRRDNTVDIVFSIKEGKEAKIKKISFYGLTAFTEKEIKKVIQTSEKGFFTWFTGSGTLKTEELEFDKERIRSLYLNKGYIKVQVAEPEIKMSEDKEDIFITFRISEGFQYKVNNIDFTGNKHIDNVTLMKMLSLKKGMYFSALKYQKDIETLTSAFTSIGYAFANISPDTKINDEKLQVDLAYNIEESILVFIDSIEIFGNTKTKDRVIRREMDIVPGQRYNSLAIKSSIRHIENTGYFETVNLVEEPVDKDKIKLKIKVKEQSTGTLAFGAGYSTLDGLTGMAQVNQRNFLGSGYSLNLKLEASEKRTDVILGFNNPWIFDRPVSFGFDIYNLHRDYYGYSKDSYGIAFKVGHQIIKRKLYLNYRLAFDDINIHDIDDDVSDYIKEQAGRQKTHSFTPSATWTTLDRPLDPTRGNKTHGYYKFAGGFLGGDTYYNKIGLESTQYHPLFWKFIASAHGEIGYVASLNSDPIPIDQRFRLGGMYSVRGYKYGDISPKDDEGYPYGGDKMLLFNAEITFPLLEDMAIKGVVFYDAGQVYDNGEDYFSYGLKQSYGGGFRWFSPMGPLRFEYGRKIGPKSDESKDRWEFSIGTMF